MRCIGCGACAQDGTVEHTATCTGHHLVLTAPLERKPYASPALGSAQPLSWDGELTRLELLALTEEVERGQYTGARKQWALMQIERCKKLLDAEMRWKLAESGAPSDPEWMRDFPIVAEAMLAQRAELTLEQATTRTPDLCRCVNPPRLAVCELVCPQCGAPRA